MKSTEIFFKPPYKERCEGCELIRQAMLPAGNIIIINCFAKHMEGVQAEVKYTVGFDGGAPGPVQTITGTCQVKEAEAQIQIDEPPTSI